MHKFLLLFIAILAFQGHSLQRYEFNAIHMGTKFRLVFYAPNDSLAQNASNKAFSTIKELDDKLSDYKTDSELNRLSRHSGTGEWITVSSQLFEVISASQSVAHHTDGAFDITVGPYVRLWRKISRSYNPALPNPDSLQKLSQSTGYNNILLDSLHQAIKLKRSHMQLDLGGIAKGYAADNALQVLQSYGISSALVDAGGDITVSEPPPGTEGWKIKIQSFSSAGDSRNLSLILANKAVATSGDLYKHILIDGERYSHIIDPRTGIGLTNQTTVTVVAPDGLTADSYASAISVLGIDKGMPLFSRNSAIEGHIATRKNGKIKQAASEGFKNYVENKK